MPSSADRITQALMRSYGSDLSPTACAHLASEVDDLVHTAIEEQWNVERLELVARGKRTTPFRDKLKQLRRKKRFTLKEVAKAAEWSPSKIARIEAGEVGVTRIDIDFLIELYGVRDRSLIDWLREEARKSRSNATRRAT